MTEPAAAAGPVAVVTGAGSGVGRAVAVALAGAGFRTVLAGRRPEPLAETAGMTMTDAPSEASVEPPQEPLIVPTDVTDEAAVRALFTTTEQRFGRVDVLFNNAGISAPPVPFDELALDQWRAVVDVNLTGMFLCAREAFGLMRRQSPAGGRIINNGSISAHTPRPLAAPYTVTKHGVAGLTRQLALDGRPYGITCGQIDIGNAASSMTARMSDGVLQADGTTRPEPTMDVESVARLVVLMATLPPDAFVLEVTVLAAGMPYVGRG